MSTRRPRVCTIILKRQRDPLLFLHAGRLVRLGLCTLEHQHERLVADIRVWCSAVKGQVRRSSACPAKQCTLVLFRRTSASGLPRNPASLSRQRQGRVYFSGNAPGQPLSCCLALLRAQPGTVPLMACIEPNSLCAEGRSVTLQPNCWASERC